MDSYFGKYKKVLTAALDALTVAEQAEQSVTGLHQAEAKLTQVVTELTGRHLGVA